ncbi:MAG TPA: hypothetical protein VGG72_23305 [Bryobacteraceae bacterium]|jgi:hypothetical protein
MPLNMPVSIGTPAKTVAALAALMKASMRDHRQGEARSIAADYSGRGPQGIYGEAGGVTRDLRQDGLVLLPATQPT